MTSTSPARKWWVLASLALYFGTLFLRLLLIGGPPFGDEGCYGFFAQMSRNGAGAFPVAPLHLYPSLMSFVGTNPSTPFLRYRVADAFVAAGASLMFFLFLSRWTKPVIAFVMAAGWSIAANLPIMVQAGFQNSIPAATFVYLSALWLLSSPWRTAPFWAGLLIPVAVFLREPFAPVVIVSLYLAFALHHRRGLLLHVAGLAVAGSLLFVWMCIFRGSPGAVMALYSEMAMLFRHNETVRDAARARWHSLRVSVRATLWLFPPVLIGLGWLLSPGREKRVAKGLAVLLCMPPLPEIFGKICGFYHWAQLLVGVVFLGAMGLQWLSSVLERIEKPWLALAAYCALAWLCGELDGRAVSRAYRDGFRMSCEYAPVMVWGNWDDPVVEENALLKIAKYIRDNTAPDDRIVTSGMYTMMFPLSGRLPPSEFVADLWLLSATRYPERRPDLIEILRQHPPRVVIDFSRFPVTLHDFWPDFESRYRLAKTYPADYYSPLDNGIVPNTITLWEHEKAVTR